jgi:hypothetical protein
VLNTHPDPGHRTPSHAIRLSDLAALDALLQEVQELFSFVAISCVTVGRAG